MVFGLWSLPWSNHATIHHPHLARVVALPIENIDTDQIIPARFLKATDKVGMGDNLFADWRYDRDGQPKPDFVLNQPESRARRCCWRAITSAAAARAEHAPWALTGYGFRAVISTSFADIFRNNALKNGLLPIAVDQDTHWQLVSLAEEDPAMALTIDLATQTLRLPDGRSVTFPIDSFSKTCMLQGVDQLGYLLKQDDTIAAFEAAHVAPVLTAG